MKKILLVDDDIKLCKNIQEHFSNTYHVDILHSYENFKSIENLETYDLFLLDYNLGSKFKTGHDVLDYIKIYSDKPIIAISGDISLQMSIGFLKRKVQSFLEKPFRIKDLENELKSLLQNKYTSNTCPPKLSLDKNKRSAMYDGKQISLTPKEFEILLFFIENKNTQIKRNDIQDLIWPKTSVSKNTFDTHLLNLKKKIPYFSENLQSIYGIGYYFNF